MIDLAPPVPPPVAAEQFCVSHNCQSAAPCSMVAEQAAEQLRLDLKQRKLQGSLACAKRTASVLHSFIAEQQPSSAIELVDAVRQLGRQLQAAKPQGLLCRVQHAHASCVLLQCKLSDQAALHSGLVSKSQAVCHSLKSVVQQLKGTLLPDRSGVAACLAAADGSCTLSCLQSWPWATWCDASCT